MAENIQRSTGQSKNYKFDRGGMPAEFGPFIGTVMNNVDPTRSGRIQVAIQQFGGPDPTKDKSLWRTVQYCSPFAGSTPKTSSSQGTGSYGQNNNAQSYGMWATAPDVGVQVLCFFVGGDPNQGYYLGYVQGQGINHMTPSIGSSKTFATQNDTQTGYLKDAQALPVTEINNAPENTEIVESPKFFDKEKPVHSYTTSILFQQGTANDPIRGPVTSSAQRESPSNTYGLSSPGRPIYKGGMQDESIAKEVAAGNKPPQAADVVGRRGGHSIVLDDGNVEGNDSIIRIKTAKGHQITMSDDGGCFYITHANGQVWLEFGQEGTVDVFATNSINMATSGSINLHADQDININAGGSLSLMSKKTTTLQSEDKLVVATKGELSLYSLTKVGVRADGTIALQSLMGGSWMAGAKLGLKAARIDMGTLSPTVPVMVPDGLTVTTSPTTTFNNSKGWSVQTDTQKSICTRVPTHEPWPFHNQGVPVPTAMEPGKPSTPVAAPKMPTGWSVTAK